MAYLALYRMFRPDTFDGVVRQEHIVRILKNQLATDRIGHAYLFCGPRGTGKTTVARIFARAINCENPKDGSPCGKCKTCRALADPSSLDISEIDAASNNGVDEMRDLREKVQYPPVSCRYKVYIVDEVHMLTDSAFNALLKTLEEPPEHAVFIMATTEPHKIPATILSRCMRFDFKLLPQEDLENHLKSVLHKIGKDYEEEAVSAIARVGAGSDRDMLSIADMCVSYSAGKLTYDDVTKVLGSADFFETGKLGSDILSGDVSAALSRLEKMISEGKGIGVLVKDLMEFLNRCAIAKMCRDADKILSLPSEMYDFVRKTGEKADGHRLLRVTEIMAKAETDLKYSTSPRIVVETAVVKASMPETDYNIDALVARINELEEKLNNASFAAPPAPEAQTERKKEGQTASPAQDSPAFEEEPAFAPYPEEEPVFDEYSFSSEKAYEPDDGRGVKMRGAEEASVAPAPASASIPVREEKRERSAESAGKEGEKAAKSSASSGDFKANTFGKFLRSLRKTNRNGVLFVMCQDLNSEFSGDTFLLSTKSEVVYKSLNREEHLSAIAEALKNIGVEDFRIEFSGDSEKKQTLTERIRADFGDVDIEER